MSEHADKLRRIADIYFARQEPQSGDLKRAAERIEQLERERDEARRLCEEMRNKSASLEHWTLPSWEEEMLPLNTPTIYSDNGG